MGSPRERHEGAGRGEVRRPRVTDVQDVWTRSGRDRVVDVVLQVAPADDLEVDLDAGFFREVVEDRGEDLHVGGGGGAGLVACPVGDGGAGNSVRAGAAAVAAATCGD